MRILSVGGYLVHSAVSVEAFRSPVSLLDFDVVIWNPSNLFDEYVCQIGSPTYQGMRNLDDDDSFKIHEDISRRKAEILELLNIGRAVFIMLPPPERCSYATGEKSFSGTGKSRVATRFVNVLKIFSAIPVKDLSSVVAEGKNIEFRGSEPFKTYWARMKDYHHYVAYMSKTIGKPFLFIKGSEKAVGSWIPTEKGVFVILPQVYSREYFKTTKDFASVCSTFVESLLDLSKELKKSTGDYSLPEWTRRYLIPGEQDQRNQLSKKEDELQRTLSEISRAKEQLASTEKYKLLFSGTGRALEVAVAEILRQIGFAVEPGAEGRDDQIITYKDKVGVVEIKGITKSAAEKHAAQLEKWVAEYITRHDQTPKGFLIVNAFYTTPLNERVEKAFPEQMVEYSANRNHCLLTSTQLLGLYLYLNSYHEERDRVIEELFSTKGVYQRFADYSSFIGIEEELEQKMEVKK